MQAPHLVTLIAFSVGFLVGPSCAQEGWNARLPGFDASAGIELLLPPGQPNGNRTHAVGALMPWAGSLWAIGGDTTGRAPAAGLLEVRSDFAWRQRVKPTSGSHRNRFVHVETGQAILGPHVISAGGKVRTIEALAAHSLVATLRHLKHPTERVYCLTAAGLFFEVQLESLATKQLFDLREALNLPRGSTPCFRSARTAQGRVFVAVDASAETVSRRRRNTGCFADWSGEDDKWRTLDPNPCIEIVTLPGTSSDDDSNPVLAVGWDDKSALLHVKEKGPWRRYRLPVAHRGWFDENGGAAVRIREIGRGRRLLSAFGLWYEFPSSATDGQPRGLRPLGRHLGRITDFASFGGSLILAGDSADQSAGQPQVRLATSTAPDLAQLAPSGVASLWREERVNSDQLSDPLLFVGFGPKSLHLTASRSVSCQVEVDPTGEGRFFVYGSIDVPATGYAFHDFPAGYSAIWVRLRALGPAEISARLIYEPQR